MNGALIMILLGPLPREALRLNDLMASLLFFEEDLVKKSTLVIVNDGNSHFDSARVNARVGFKKIIVLNNPYIRNGGGPLVYDRMTAGVLAALQSAVISDDYEFVLKLDTDALVCGCFAEKIGRFFSSNPRSGMIGSLDSNPDGSSRDCREWWSKWIRGTCGLFPKHWVRLRLKEGLPLNPFTEIMRWHRRHCILRSALQSGWLCGANILGGAYALSPHAIVELRSKKYLIRDAFLFDGTRVPEDIVVSMLVAALGLTLDGYNRAGEVFAVWYQKPTLSMQTLIERRYGLVHSIKSEDPLEEATLRSELAELAQIPHELCKRLHAFADR